jgi:hypothetical protein
MQAGPLRVEQRGTDVIQSFDPDHPAYDEARAAMRNEVESTPLRIEALRSQISDLAAPFHAFDIVYAAWMTYGLVRPGTFASSQPNGATATSEYIAHVMLDRPTPEPTREATPKDYGQGPDVLAIGEAVHDSLMRLPLWFSFRQGEGDHEISPFLEIRSRLYMHRLSIRSLTYEWQESETLVTLFEPFNDQLRRGLGFSVQDGIKLSDSLGPLLLQHTTELREHARDHAKKMKETVRAIRARGEGDSASTDRWEQLADRSEKFSDDWIDHAAMSWMGAFIGRNSSFSAEQLAEHAEVSVEAAQHFLDAFSVDFGHRADADLWREEPERAIGGEMEVMRQRPILHDGVGNYLPAAIDSVVYGLRDRFTDCLKQDAKAWKRYDRHRAASLETRALAALTAALAPDWAHGSVAYEYVDDAGNLAYGEADGVLRHDSVVVLLEAKAGSLTASARRAAPERLERSLKDLVVAAHDQLSRAERALVRGEATKVTDKAGRPLSLEIEGVERVLRVAVNLEDLSSVTPGVWLLQDAELLPDTENAPWVVGIHELELICSMTERPAQLVHYVLRRIRTYRQRVWAMDEMDFWMRYLTLGLWWDDETLDNQMITLSSHTEPLDRWLYGEKGFSEKTKPPRQKLDNATRRLLDEIEATGAPGRLEAQVMLLDFDGPVRKRIAKRLQQSAAQSQRDGKPHDMTLIVDNDMAITVESLPRGTPAGATERLAAYGLAKSEEHGLRRWLGLSTGPGQGGKLTTMVLLVEPARLSEA